MDESVNGKFNNLICWSLLKFKEHKKSGKLILDENSALVPPTRLELVSRV